MFPVLMRKKQLRKREKNLSRLARLKRAKRIRRRNRISFLAISLGILWMFMPIVSQRATEENVKEYYTFFSGIWGTWGIVDNTETDWGWRTRTYYVFSRGQFKEAAWTGALAVSDKGDFPIDIDGDGRKELICNEQAPDGQVHAKAVDFHGGLFSEGYVEVSQELLNAYPWWGAAAVQVYYIPSRKVYNVCYYSQDGKTLGVHNIYLDEACYSWDGIWPEDSDLI